MTIHHVNDEILLFLSEVVVAKKYFNPIFVTYNPYIVMISSFDFFNTTHVVNLDKQLFLSVVV